MINQPVGQKFLTNVKVVRLKKNGKKFELATYPNKVMPWRNKIETDIDEVLQTPTIFSNVKQGEIAKKVDIEEAFEGMTEDEIVEHILLKGELQISMKERQFEIEKVQREIINIIAEICINTSTGKPFSIGIIEKALKDIHYSTKLNKTAKSQALTAISLLQEKDVIPISRSLMKLMVESQSKYAKVLKNKLKTYIIDVEEEDDEDNEFFIIFTIEPSQFREVNQLVQKFTKKSGIVEVLDNSVSSNNDNDDEDDDFL
eukprot:TRINITY_DN13056_c0_g1_i1.p1 TRINITY_DN13056_c0_g1~~TRINITY_DN13056_c0_g1_i1.p1  ORF type:complete len:258 (+),score=72.01 TRINITY_DN13056_c0_g1_i1:119-892(+)